MTITVLGFDADDTLWHSENGFHITTQRYAELVAPYCDGRSNAEVIDHLNRTERGNLQYFGYGVKSFTLSMVDAAVACSNGTLPVGVVAELIELGRRQLAEPVELLPGVGEVIKRLAGSYRMLLITKGDLLHQERKIRESGLAEHFEALEIVTEKDPATYRRILDEHGVRPEEFVMFGNSVKSDVLPVLQIGGQAVHIPYEYLWEMEQAEHDGTVIELTAITEVPTWLAEHQ
jgi:putative hydrolase of the HAD superfamily